MKYAIGIDIGGTSVKGVAVDRIGQILVKKWLPLEGRAPIPLALEVFASLQGNFNDKATDAVGVAAPGIAAPDGSSIWWMQGRLAELQGFDWTSYLQQARPVAVLNDAQAALLGEVWQGAARGCGNVVMLTLGTGVGGAAMVDGNLLRGHLGRAGHFGHICLDPHGSPDIVNTPGSLEDAIGNCTVERRSGGRFHSTGDVIDTVLLGDDQAKQIWHHSIRALACGIASLINVLDPEVVILGGGMIAADAALFDPLRAEMEHVEWRPHGRQVKIVPAAVGEFAGALGAAYNVIKHDSR